MDIKSLDPIHMVNPDKYVAIWQYLFAHILSGFFARFLAAVFLGLSFWFGVRRRSFQIGVALFIITLLITFAAPLIKITGLM